MKKLENSFAVTGFIGKDAEIRSFQTASVARFSIAISRAEKEGEETTYVSSFMGVEAWRKNEALDSFDVLKKGNLVTVEGYFKPEEWTDAESGAKRSRIVMVATKFYLAPEKKRGEACSQAGSNQEEKKIFQIGEAASAAFLLHRIRIGFAYTQTDPPAPSVVCFPFACRCRL
jgi:single-strand DNA-binding protein